MQDTYRHKGLRRLLVRELQQKGIADAAVLAAIGAVPRHFFVEKAFEELAYTDRALSIGNEQTISQPYTVAYQTTLLEVEAGCTVLEVGTGSGYQACVLAALGAEVYTVERIAALFERTQILIREALPYYAHIRFFHRDGGEGLPECAPFERILVTCAAPAIPETLCEQLSVGGVMVIPVGMEVQTMMRIRRTSATTWREEAFAEFRFVPLLNGKG